MGVSYKLKLEGLVIMMNKDKKKIYIEEMKNYLLAKTSSVLYYSLSRFNS